MAKQVTTPVQEVAITAEMLDDNTLVLHGAKYRPVPNATVNLASGSYAAYVGEDGRPIAVRWTNAWHHTILAHCNGVWCTVKTQVTS